jgi:uncharacterized protein (TIGR02266 family)
LSDLDKYLSGSPSDLPLSDQPPGRSPGASASRSRETAGMPSVERFLGEEADLVGRMLAGYRIERKLGSGAVGAVYLAEQVALSRPVALKVLSGARARSSEYQARFVREARAVARLVHPNAVQVYDVGQADGYHYIALEFVDGQTLAELLERRGRLPWRAALEICRQAASSLARAHEMGIIHRDIKPENLMLSRRGEVKVTDFGLARLGGDPSITHHGTILGTPFYMSPEQAEGNEAGTAADIYSLGCTLYHILVGNPPFEGLTALDVARKHVVEPPRPPAELVAGLPAAISELVLDMMKKLPAERPASGRELLDLIVAVRRTAEAAEAEAVEFFAAAPAVAAQPAAPEAPAAPAPPPPGGAPAEAARRAVIREVLGPEGRAYTRVPAELVAQMRPAELPAGTRQQLAAKVVNLSEGGLFVACEKPLPVGTILDLTFRPSAEAAEVEALATVRWLSDSPQGMGLEFVRLAEAERTRIRTLVERAEAEMVMASLTRTELHRRLLKAYYCDTSARCGLAELAERAGTGLVMAREGLKPFVRHKLARLSESRVEFRPPQGQVLAERIKNWVLKHGLS